MRGMNLNVPFAHARRHFFRLAQSIYCENSRTCIFINMLFSRNNMVILNVLTHSTYLPQMFLHNRRTFVCVEVLRPNQPYGVMSSAVNLPSHTFTGQARSSKRLTSIVHILSPDTDNCPSWISRRERMTVENILWSISTKECCRPRRGLNPRPPGLQSDGASNWATEADQSSYIPNHLN